MVLKCQTHNDGSLCVKIGFMKMLDDGNFLWFGRYYELRKLVYPNTNLPHHISIPDEPFWIKIKTMKYKKELKCK